MLMNRFIDLHRCGTLAGINIYESQSADGRAGFIQKLKIARLEVYETAYCFELISANTSYLNTSDDIYSSLQTLKILLQKIISTTKIFKS